MSGVYIIDIIFLFAAVAQWSCGRFLGSVGKRRACRRTVPFGQFLSQFWCVFVNLIFDKPCEI